tara:strand:- start:801 stop:1004 length:204 start_codon:yes stop_codon:yes gene_type:complete
MAINQKNLKVKAVEELRKFIIDKIQTIDDPVLISRAYETVSGNLCTGEAEVEGSTEDFVYVYEYQGN